MFTCGTDLMLPVGVNAYLRELLASNTDTPVGDAHEMAAAFLTKLGEIKDESAIPQVRLGGGIKAIYCKSLMLEALDLELNRRETLPDRTICF